MKKLKNIFIFFIFFATIFIGCEKKDMGPENYFESQINSLDKAFVPTEITIKNGITTITAQFNDQRITRTIDITINADEIGNYTQTFDYKTGVSVSECGLSYSIINKNDVANPTFFTSFEGNVVLSDISRRKNQISGSYIFKLNSFPFIDMPYYIEGKFIKLEYR